MSKKSLCSRLKHVFDRGPKSREQDRHDVPSALAGSSVATVTSKNVEQIPTTTYTTINDVSRPRPLDISPTIASQSELPHPHEGLATSDAANHSDTSRSTMSLPARLWDRAYDELKQEDAALVSAYEKILSSQLQDGLGSSVPESQLNAIAQLDPDTRRRQMDELVRAGLAKIAPEAKVKEGAGTAMGVVQSIKDVISTAVQATPQAALPWAGVCVALEMLTNPITSTETNRHGVDYVIGRIFWYWNLSDNLFKESVADHNELSGTKRELENHLVDIYKALLSYQMKSVYSYYRHRGLVFLRDIVKLDDWKGDLDAIKVAENQFPQDSTAYTTQQKKLLLEEVVGYVKNQELKQMSDTDQQCLANIRRDTDPYHDKTRIEQTKGGLLQDSYRWILENPDFQQWRNRSENRMLWIKGDPGKGKTMLLCGIVDELKRSNTPALLSFFFCQATDNRINNATAVLRGLIYMLVDRQPLLISHVREKYDNKGKPLFEDANAWVVLEGVFDNILQDPALGKVYLVIDALDECVTDLPQLLDLIVQKSSVSPHIKWLVSSRNSPLIEESLKTVSQNVPLSLELNAESVATAVDAFIRHKVSQLADLKNYDEETRVAVQCHLVRNADGTFLWVALVCKELADS
ncbi:hypothetical protein H9Q74_009701 [Fusarium xylarioides]|nr:hypothetical protein H9Q71_010191 [Fusarium xylarioides]KAG5819040.1 hypothetical protein H9Q74_009701 [Fusarium xylarioides]